MENESIILPDENVLSVGIDHIKMMIGGFNVFGQYDYGGKVSTFEFKFNHDWQDCSLRELEEFIQAELSKELCPVN